MASSVLLSQEGASAPTGTYSYSSRPRVIPVRRRYRGSPEISEQEDSRTGYGNLMYDRRVVRGNTYALQPLPWGPEPDPLEIQKQREAHRKMLARKQAKEKLETKSPEEVASSLRVDVQTELYLEEIADRIIEVDMECQTDEFLERPETPLYVPAKTGKDVATQIEEGELFDFNLEVKPMLEVLVGKTMEQALLEVMEEEELSNLRAHQYAYEELRNAEMAEVQRLEEQERRHNEEKERRIEQQIQIQQKKKETSEKVAARAFALQYLTDLIPSVFSKLRDNGYFYDPVERDIEDEFLPYLAETVERSFEKKLLGRIMMDCLIHEVTGKRLDDVAENQGPRPRRKHRKSEKGHRHSTSRKTSNGGPSSRRPSDQL